MLPKQYSFIGNIVKPHGNKGEVIINLKNLISDFSKFKFVFIQIDNKYIPFEITNRTKRSDYQYIIKFLDVDDILDSQNISSKEIYIDKKLLSDSDNNESLMLEGFQLFDNDEYIGEIIGVLEMVHQNLLRVMVDKKEVLIPFVDSIINKIDYKKKQVFSDLPDGILDL